MKICHITSVHQTYDVRIFKKECSSLAEVEDYEVFLVGPGESRMENNINIIGVGDVPLNRFVRMIRFDAIVIKKAISIRADVYHLHDPELLRYAKELKNIGAKVIFDSHENVLDSIDDKTYLPIVFRKIAKQYYAKLQSAIFPNLDGIIVVTPQMEKEHKKFNSKVVVIANYPIIMHQKENEEIIPGRIVFAGGITDAWSHKEIICAIEDINGVEYRIFGPADQKYLNQLKQLPGWEKVFYGGKIPFENVQDEIAKANLCVALIKPCKNTFFNEGTLGNTKLFEAMERSKPILATNFVLWEKIVKKCKCGICVDPSNVDDIRHGIVTLMNNQQNAKEMGGRGRRLIETEYNWEIDKEKLLALYEEILKS